MLVIVMLVIVVLVIVVLVNRQRVASLSCFAALTGGNLDGAELSLLGGVAILEKTFLLLGGSVLLATHDTTPLVHHEVRLG